MQLNVMERLLLLGILPKQGDFLTLKILRKLKESLSFSEKELEELSFKQKVACPQCGQSMSSPEPVTCGTCDELMTPTGEVSWKLSKDPNKDIHMGNKAESTCKQALEDLDKKKQLEEKHLSLYEKFVGLGQEAE